VAEHAALCLLRRSLGFFRLTRRGDRPRIIPPENLELDKPHRQDAHVLRAIARAWNWKRKLERGAANTITELAKGEKISDR